MSEISIDIEVLSHLIKHCQEGIEKCFERIEKLEDMARERANLINYKSYLQLSDRIFSLEKSIENYRGYKTPHKCPVCDGIGISRNHLFLIEGEIADVRCICCEGKGAVWG